MEYPRESMITECMRLLMENHKPQGFSPFLSCILMAIKSSSLVEGTRVLILDTYIPTMNIKFQHQIFLQVNGHIIATRIQEKA